MKPEHAGDLDIPALARTLLLGIEERGKDATGAAWFGKKGGACLQKAPVPATNFVRKLTLGKSTTTAVLHTRQATMGLPKWNENNHPIIAPGEQGHRVIGTHNGWVNNVGTLVQRHHLPRKAQVDSEVIFSLLSKYGEDYHLIGQEVFGNYACAWIREDQPNHLYLMRGYASPLVVLENEYGVFYASTSYALSDIARHLGEPKLGYMHVVEGRALHVVDGEVASTHSFRPSAAEEDWKWENTKRWRKYQWDGSKTGATTTYTPRPATAPTQKAYVNAPGSRRSYLGFQANAMAEFLPELEKKGDSCQSEYGKYIWTGDKCIEFHPYKHTTVESEIELAALEDLLYISSSWEGAIPPLVQDDINELMVRVYASDEDDGKGSDLEVWKEQDYRTISGETESGQPYIVFNNSIYLKNMESGEYENSGVTYREFLDYGNDAFDLSIVPESEENLEDDDQVEESVRQTMEELTG